jgi:hypothetical protein
MPKSTVVDIPEAAQAQMLTVLRCARYGYLLALHILLVCAAGRHPPDSAAVLFCSRSRVYRTVRADQAGTLGLEHDAPGRLMPPRRTPVRLPTRRRSRLARLKVPPRADGWCRTRWRGATLALTLQATRGLTVAAETMRRWRHALDGVWKRAKLVAKDDDPHRVERLARIRMVYARLRPWAAMVVADELASPWLPTVGDAWMPQGTQVEVMTPGTHTKPDLAGALELSTGTLHHCRGPRHTTGLLRERLPRLDDAYPAPQCQRVSVVVDHDQIHQATAVEPWLAHHPRVERLWLPTDGPRATPIARAFGDVHDLCTRHHRRTRVRDLKTVTDVAAHLHVNGPWTYQLSELYDAPAVTAAGEHIAAEEPTKVAA